MNCHEKYLDVTLEVLNILIHFNLFVFELGTPKALESLRERLIERYGIFAMSVIRCNVGVGMISCDDLRQSITRTGVKLDRFEMNRVKYLLMIIFVL